MSLPNSTLAGCPPVPTQFPLPVPEFLSENPYFGAGFGLAALGFGMSVVRSSAVLLRLVSSRSLLTSLEVHNRDPAYEWIVRWLESTTQGKCRRVVANTTRRQTKSGKSITQFSLSPSVGRHFVRYRGSWFMVERERELRAKGSAFDSSGFSSSHSGGDVWESIKLTTIGRNPQIYLDLMNDAQSLATEKQMDFTTVYTSFGFEGWRPFGNPRRKRELSSVVLDDGVSERIVDDIYQFLTSRKWYMDRGIPYRRGFLLHGSPGSGKSSFVFALAGHIGYDICLMSLATPGLTDDHLAVSLISVPEKSIVLFEDVDCLFNNHSDQMNHSDQRRAENTRNYLSFSGFLNALDGIAAGEERIVFMTTNHVSRLDPALIRPGRVDVIQECGDATSFQIAHILHRFFPELSENEELTQKFVDSVQGRGVSMAEIQEYFLLHRDDGVLAVEDASVWVESLKSSVRHLNKDPSNQNTPHTPDPQQTSDMQRILDLHL